MTDTFSKEKRSRIMSLIKSKNNKSTEIKLIEIFKSHKIHGWQRNYKVIGKPDFVFLKKKIAIFVDGCFWHGHNCRNTTPKNNSSYWRVKQQKNKEHDKTVTNLFYKKKWIVLRIWECELKKKIREHLLIKIETILNSERQL